MAVTARGRPVPEYKVERKERIKELLEKYQVIGLTSMEGMGARQLQGLRKKLKDTAIIKVDKNTLIARSLMEIKGKKKNADKLSEYVKGPVALILTNMNPFKLSRILDKSKTRTAAKPDTVSPVEIVVPAGNTGFPPGPIISELGEVGLPTRVESGTIWITKDTVVAKPGDFIPKKLALVLKRLGIEPIEVGLDLHVAYDDGLILTRDILSKKPEEYLEEIKEAHIQALNLAVHASIATPETVIMMLRKAYMEASNLAMNAELVIPETLPNIIRKAESQALSIAMRLSAKDPSLSLSAEKR
ncbi:MAG: 50S ribosomal protein L10 [Candidatus Freyarchaeota archaeon]|nr:50S ribosomal protein L10 [Candidatus Jordarchaeia archaeon]MBS7269813.1 50S ribosomal protein L10 [Candidatus Jordarchaeia archaeon]MBS7280545.1 50S ribosomal protein L10 [Candidatus Jordarchaeia archaeon]